MVGQTEEDLEAEVVEGGIKVVVGITETTVVRITQKLEPCGRPGECRKKNDGVETWIGAGDKNKSQSWNAGSCGTSNQTTGLSYSKGRNQPTAGVICCW